MPVPPFKVFMHGTLSSAANGTTHKIAEWSERVAADFGLSEAQRAETISSGSATYADRVQWSLTYLSQAGLMERVGRGLYQITSSGREFLKKHPSSFEQSDLMTIPAFRDFATRRGTRSRSTTTAREIVPDSAADVVSPEEQLERAYAGLEATLRDDLLAQVREITPKQFEHLIVRLLVAMGYAGSDPDAGAVLGGSGDGGLDGVIRQDPLGLDNVYVQAKRYTTGNVGAPEIQGFLGALSMKGVTKGVFLTTSTFTPSATSSAKQNPSFKVSLIDGPELVRLMIERRVGVVTMRALEIRKIDVNFFDDLGLI